MDLCHCSSRPQRRFLFSRKLWLVLGVGSWVLLARPVVAQVPEDASHAEPFSAEFDVVIAGGSTAALAAALAAADEEKRTALLEPTDWVGGQLTSSGVSAVDECWHRFNDSETKKVVLDAAGMARDPRNMNPNFRDMLERIGNPGRGWVSRFCFEPPHLLAQELIPQLARRSQRLMVYYNTVVKRADVDAERRKIQRVLAIRRHPRAHVPWNGYDRFASEDLVDWYSTKDSPRFTKEVLSFENHGSTVFIDATEWGELIVLASDRYLQGVEHNEGETVGQEQCGQCITYGLVQRYRATPGKEAQLVGKQVDRIGFGAYATKPDAWVKVWTYRRIRSTQEAPTVGDLCLQNWGYYPEMDEGGNDYPYGYLFLNRAETAGQRSDWQGGINLDVLKAAEERAIAWHFWFKRQAPEGIDPEQIELEKGVLGTGHGLSKLPYIRDTRRSIGIDGFILTYDDLSGDWREQSFATPFEDRVALGCYAADIHAMAGCKYPAYVHPKTQPLPFHIPFRALTHGDLDNLLVAGKTMAQSFLSNSATRLHPIEWATGTAAGSAAAMMAQEAWTSRQMFGEIGRLQARIRNYQPIDWTIVASP